MLHSTAFRRLQYKTQVFIYHEGDHFRNRLTHTLEVAQIARTISRALGCNEDLTEAIVLAHDLGHTPFGHSGERALQPLLAAHGGFEHNRQSLRIVDLLERRLPDAPGLNLTGDTRAGLLKHGADVPRYPHPVPLPPLGASPGAEAQIADRSDEIAYHGHDIDDALRSGILQPSDLEVVALWGRARERARERDGGESPRAVIVALIDALATDLIETSSQRLRASGAESPEAVRASPEPLVALSDEGGRARRELAEFLLDRVYRHHEVLEMGRLGERVVTELWQAYSADPGLVPARTIDSGRHPGGVVEPVERAIADYLAGMTDRFALEEHRKLFGADGRD